MFKTLKYLFVIFITFALSGCATGCKQACILGIGPGMPLFDSYATYMNTKDGCQFTGKPEGYKIPEYCGSSKGKIYTINQNGNQIFIDRK